MVCVPCSMCRDTLTKLNGMVEGLIYIYIYIYYTHRYVPAYRLSMIAVLFSIGTSRAWLRVRNVVVLAASPIREGVKILYSSVWFILFFFCVCADWYFKCFCVVVGRNEHFMCTLYFVNSTIILRCY